MTYMNDSAIVEDLDTTLERGDLAVGVVFRMTLFRQIKSELQRDGSNGLPRPTLAFHEPGKVTVVIGY